MNKLQRNIKSMSCPYVLMYKATQGIGESKLTGSTWDKTTMNVILLDDTNVPKGMSKGDTPETVASEPSVPLEKGQMIRVEMKGHFDIKVSNFYSLKGLTYKRGAAGETYYSCASIEFIPTMSYDNITEICQSLPAGKYYRLKEDGSNYFARPHYTAVDGTLKPSPLEYTLYDGTVIPAFTGPKGDNKKHDRIVFVTPDVDLYTCVYNPDMCGVPPSTWDYIFPHLHGSLITSPDTLTLTPQPYGVDEKGRLGVFSIFLFDLKNTVQECGIRMNSYEEYAEIKEKTSDRIVPSEPNTLVLPVHTARLFFGATKEEFEKYDSVYLLPNQQIPSKEDTFIKNLMNMCAFVPTFNFCFVGVPKNMRETKRVRFTEEE